MAANNINTVYAVYSDRDMARLFESLPMPPIDKQTFIADYSALKQNQIDTRSNILTVEERITITENRIDAIDEQLVIINERIDAVETAAFLAIIT